MKSTDDAAGGEDVRGPEEKVVKDHPVIGYLAVISGVLGVFSFGIIFVPMALAFSVAALIAGQGVWGFSGLVLAALGLANSPSLWALLGLGAAASFLGIM